MSTKTDCAYIAGIIDGEGWISIIHFLHHNRQSWQMRVGVAVTSHKIIDKIVGIFGGYKHSRKRDGTNFVIYDWFIYSEKAYEMLKKIKPYLKEKKAQADVAIQFYVHQRNYYKNCRELTPQELDIRAKYKERLKQLKTAFLTPIALAETKCRNVSNDEAIVQPS